MTGWAWPALLSSSLLTVAAAATLLEATVLLLAIRAATRARYRSERPGVAPFAALPTPPAVAAFVDGALPGSRPEELIATVEGLLTPALIREVVVTLPEGAAGDAAAAALDARFALHADGRGARSVTHPKLTLLRAPLHEAERWALEHLRSDLLLPLRAGAHVLPSALERAAQALATAPDAVGLAAVRTPRGRGFGRQLVAIRHARSVAAPQLAFGELSIQALLPRCAALLRRDAVATATEEVPVRVLLLAETLVETSTPTAEGVPFVGALQRGPPGSLARPLGTVATLLAHPGAPRLRGLTLLVLTLLVPVGGGDLSSAGILGTLLLLQAGLAAAAAADLALLLRPDLRGARSGWSLRMAAPPEALGIGPPLVVPGSGGEAGGTMASMATRNDT